jgi:LL-diaminopimelate aminotransferase
MAIALTSQLFVLQPLRAGIQKAFYADLGIEETEIFVSDGAKCDITRLQVLN